MPKAVYARHGIAAACVLLLSACGSDDAPHDRLAQHCADLAGYALDDGSLQTEIVAADEIVQGLAVERHCRVTGSMHPRTGEDGKPYAIGFELRLPADWNGRLLYQGGGGNDGVIRPALGTQGTTDPALNQGYAVVSTDAGHQGADASFALDPQARIDHAYHAHDVVATTARTLLDEYYGKTPEYSYFIGCSGGGRQGMMFTQRFPDYFDGVLAIAPAMSVASNASIAAAWSTVELAAIAPTDGAGAPILAQALTDGDLALLRDDILARCDAQDGLVDGLVSNPAACQYDPAPLQCQAGASATQACLTPEKVTALQRIFAAPHDSAGNQLYTSWPWDPGVGHPANDWRAWRLGTSPTAQSNARHVTLMNDAIAHEFFTPPQPDFNILDFDFDTDPARMQAFSAIYDTHTDARLDNYKASGGKLMMVHGMADPIFSAHESIDYYQRLRSAHPDDADEFARLYLIPGMGHCAGGAATDAWDGLGTLAAWVENGTQPQEILAAGTRVYPDRTRPLCPYPGYARYNGSGDPESADSFTCVQP